MGMIERWGRPNGWRDVLATSLPLVASTAATTVMLFTDRMFLGQYSVEAVAAAVPAGMAAFSLICFFQGIVCYVNTFVAQYVGADNPRKVGAVVWHALYLALLSGGLLAAVSGLSGPLFAWAGHGPDVQPLEQAYFRILLLGSVLGLAGNALSCFYSGQGRTSVVMAVSLLGAGLNVPLDYAWINGVWGLPEWGVVGAAWATVVSHGVTALAYSLLMLRPRETEGFALRDGLAFDRDLFWRMLVYGVPAGASFFLDIFAYAVFILLVGRLGTLELAATNVVFSINSLAFMPMIGFHIAVSILVGQALGRGSPGAAEDATRSAFQLTFVYMLFVGALYVFAPEALLSLFQAREGDPADTARIVGLGVVLLRFVALYSLFDALNLVYSGALKGAGDTAYTGWMTAVLSLGLFVVPTYVALVHLGAGLYVAWGIATLYTCSIAVAFWLRYRGGLWKGMLVIEPAA